MEHALHFEQTESEQVSDQRAAEGRRVILVLACAGVAGVVGYLTNAGGSGFDIAEIGLQLATGLVAFIVAFALIRVGDLVIGRRQSRERARHATQLSLQLRRTLEERHPGVTKRSQAVDPATLIDRLRRAEDDGTGQHDQGHVSQG